jgi:phage shock protein PspC (stress-responsive transcriptional regulator)
METMMQAQVNEEQTYTPLPLRAHTILGVCEAIGEDFGFNPVLLRIPLAASVIISPIIAISAYLALGAAVLASRYFFPRPKAPTPSESQTEAANEQGELKKAA